VADVRSGVLGADFYIVAYATVAGLGGTPGDLYFEAIISFGPGKGFRPDFLPPGRRGSQTEKLV
jgi:hypothetical protein